MTFEEFYEETFLKPTFKNIGYPSRLLAVKATWQAAEKATEQRVIEGVICDIRLFLGDTLRSSMTCMLDINVVLKKLEDKLKQKYLKE